MEGLEIFFIVGILSIITFGFLSLLILNKQPKKINYITPFKIITIASVIFMILTIIISRDGWVIMGNAFFVAAIISGSFIGTHLPFISLKYRGSKKAK